MKIGGRNTMAHPYYGLNELREMFLSYFESKGHLRGEFPHRPPRCSRDPDPC